MASGAGGSESGKGRVLVTGATGFVGRYLVPLLLHRGYGVRGTYREPPRPRDFPSDVEWVEVADIGPHTDWGPALHGVDHVIHLAGLAHRFGGGGHATKEEFSRVNHMGTRRLSEMAREVGGVERFVFLSSVGAICSLAEEVVTEATIPNPDTHYGQSKGAGEEAIEEVLKNSHMDWCILRSPLVYGPGNPGNMGRLVRLINRGVPLPLAGVENRRSFVFIGNLADLLERTLRHPAASKRTFLVSDGEDLSTSELVRRLSRHAKRPVRIFPMPGKMLRGMGRVGDAVAPLVGRSVGVSTYSVERLMGSLQVDSEPVRKELGWQPCFTLDEGLAQTLGTQPTVFPDRTEARWSLEWGAGVRIAAPHRPEGGTPEGAITLVTGARGFVAPHLLQALVAGGVRTRGLVRQPTNGDPSAWRVDGVEYVKGDLTHVGSLGGALRGVDTVIHLAGRAHVMDEHEPSARDSFFRVNVGGTETLLSEALQAGVDRFLFLSSVKALGEVASHGPWSDHTSPSPSGAYGESKLAAERAIRRITAGTSMHAPILRFPILYGPGVKANILRLFQLVSQGVVLPLGRVENRRSLLYVENAVSAMQAALDTPEARDAILVVSDLEDVSTPELVRRIGRALGKGARLVPIPVSLFRFSGQVGDLAQRILPVPLNSGVVDRLVGSLAVDASGIVDLTGYSPPFSLDEGLRRTAEWFQNGRS